MYKVSKFSYSCKNDKGDLLLYNTLMGTNSFCKFKDSDINSIKDEKFLDKLSQEEALKLLEKGIIVEKNLDEEAILHETVLREISPSTLTIFINPTESCNFRCKYCYENHTSGMMQIATQNEIIRTVRDNIHHYTALHVSWFGGEPLLYPDCIEYLTNNFKKICKFNKRGYSASITTNGYLLDPEMFNKLLDLGIKSYQITLDGIKETHDSYRVMNCGLPTYNKIYDNVLKIKKIKRRDYIINIRVNLTLDIKPYIKEFMQSIDKLCRNDHRITVSLKKVGNWLNKSDGSILKQLINDDNFLCDIYEQFIKTNYAININTNFLNPGGIVCYAAKRNNYFIPSNGSLHKCTVNFETIGTEIGEIKDGRIYHNAHYYSMISNSKKCKSFDTCFAAPLCCGDPCPLKTYDNHNCSIIDTQLNHIIILIDKNKPFFVIGDNSDE